VCECGFVDGVDLYFWGFGLIRGDGFSDVIILFSDVYGFGEFHKNVNVFKRKCLYNGDVRCEM
jgi:hypothetical protein